ncbi:MAG: RHS domain-containing protein, partial [Rhodocyclaceae bacterium]|nr:RHS domain-containing protein [Rhodocyclaceae bacterium]
MHPKALQRLVVRKTGNGRSPSSGLCAPLERCSTRSHAGAWERSYAGLPPGPAAPLWRSYRYDAAGNLQDAIARKSAGLTTDNRLRVWQDLRFDYDPWGNVSAKRKGAAQIQHFHYDDEDRLVAVRTENPYGVSDTTFAYDALGRRSTRTCSTLPAGSAETLIEQRRYVWSGMRMLQDIGANQLTTYIYDPDQDYVPLARLDHARHADGSLAGEPRCYWFHTDQLGTPLELTDETGNTVWAGRHKAWGRLDGIAPATGAIEQPLRFQGQYADASTGLHYNTFRYYDPDVGRFCSHDPIGIAGGENLYAYAPNPTGWVDPWGW